MAQEYIIQECLNSSPVCLFKVYVHPQSWETRYILLLWLSIIVIIPFDLCRMDGSALRDGPWHSTIDRILAVGKLYLLVTDKSRDAAALLLAK